MDAAQIPVLILVGGKGSRLANVTDLPKPLVPVAGYPFLVYLLASLHIQGFRRIYLLSGYKAELFERRLREVQETLAIDWLAEMSIRYLPEAEPLGTGGALRQGLAAMNEFALVLNGDSYCRCDYNELLALLDRHSVDFALTAFEIASVVDYGSLELVAEGRVQRFLEKGRQGAGWINAGIYALRRRFVAEQIPMTPCSLEVDILPQQAAAGEVWSLKTSGFFHDIGTPQRLAQAQLLFPPPELAGRIGT
jgi:NDP-sugar pyrophosphorylase family protein